jgi:hypothetical protein
MTRTMRLTKDDKRPSPPAAMETIAASNMPFVLPRIALGHRWLDVGRLG